MLFTCHRIFEQHNNITMCDYIMSLNKPCWSRPKKSGTVVSRRTERARMVCERRSPEGQNRAGRGRASEEVRLMVGRAQKVGHGACCPTRKFV